MEKLLSSTHSTPITPFEQIALPSGGEPPLSGSNLLAVHPELAQVDWVFAYGSLIWNPEFSFQRRSIAKVHGFHRAFCVSSTLYRGTPETPGIVLGLDFGGCVEGVAFALNSADRLEALAGVMRREMPPHSIHQVYEKRLVNARLADGQTVKALTFVANHASLSYVRLTEAQILQRLRDCCGQRGANCDYAINTWEALKQLGIHDARLERLAAHLSTSRNETLSA
jgi:glutathione-specific gamma-glutamylcyclotransferase